MAAGHGRQRHPDHDARRPRTWPRPTTSFLEVELTATDSQGLSTTVTRELRPRLVDLTFVTEPAGLSVGINGEPVTGPRTFSSWEGWAFPASADRQQDGSGAWWVFDHWSDGGAASHVDHHRRVARDLHGHLPAERGARRDRIVGVDARGHSADDHAPRLRRRRGPITRAIFQSPTRGTLGPIAGANVTYTPTAQLNGADSFQFTAGDGAATSAPATVSITVTEVNDPPDAVNDTTTVAEDGNVLVNVRSNDTKGPSNESSQTLTVASAGTPAHGTATIESGSIRYRPAANYSGPDSFGYQVCDDGTTNGAAAPLCDSATVSVTVTAVNDPPVAVDDTASTSIGREITIDVLANDAKGPPDEAGQTLTIGTLGAPAHGTATVQSGKVRYTPAAGYLGPDSFTYEACDGGGLCDTGQVTISVDVNSPPVANDVVATALEDVETTIDLAATDPEGGTLTFAVVSPPAHGTVVGLAGRALRYRPAPNYHGADSLTFRAGDGSLQSNVATASLTVHEVNDTAGRRGRCDQVRKRRSGGRERPRQRLSRPGRRARTGPPPGGRLGPAARVGGADGRRADPLRALADLQRRRRLHVHRLRRRPHGWAPGSGLRGGQRRLRFRVHACSGQRQRARVVGGRRAGTVATAQLGAVVRDAARRDVQLAAL